MTFHQIAVLKCYYCFIYSLSLLTHLTLYIIPGFLNVYFSWFLSQQYFWQCPLLNFCCVCRYKQYFSQSLEKSVHESYKLKKLVCTVFLGILLKSIVSMEKKVEKCQKFWCILSSCAVLGRKDSFAASQCMLPKVLIFPAIYIFLLFMDGHIWSICGHFLAGNRQAFLAFANYESRSWLKTK